MNIKTLKDLLFIICSSSIIVVLSGCKKVETTRTTIVSNVTTQTTIAFDEVTINNEFDYFVDDAVTILSNHKATIANAYIDTSRINKGVIEITYNEKKEPDGVKVPTGADSIHLNGKNWGTPGTTASLSFNNINAPTGYEIMFYSIELPSIDTASVTFKGNINLTNTYGGLLQNVFGADSLVVHIRADNTFYTFNDQAAIIQFYAFNVNQSRSYTIANSNMYATTRGDTALNGYSAVGNWGENRFGNIYYSAITASVVQNISNAALSYNPLSGAKVTEGISEPVLSTYGVNQMGSLQNSGTPYGFNITWINGVQDSVVVAYYY